jgi:hypothetical protein
MPIQPKRCDCKSFARKKSESDNMRPTAEDQKTKRHSGRAATQLWLKASSM